MRLAVAALALVAGCRFGVLGLDEDLGVSDDGSAGGDAAVELDGGLDGGQPDLVPFPDLHQTRDGILPGEVGWPCDQAKECQSGFCIDSICCEELCDQFDPANLCKACNVPGFEGRCEKTLDGTDPRGQCDQDTLDSCGRDGLCDGNGGCRKWGAGTPCGLPQCKAGSVTYAPACNGLGACIVGTSASCFPYLCASATACGNMCGGPSDCANMTCANGSCGAKATGQPCSSPTECQSNVCAQGVCCLTACSGTCKSCNVPGQVGTCSNIPSGSDPLGHCDPELRQTCGRDGTCDGLGACRKYSTVTPCQPPTCMGDDAVPARFCDGAGTCLTMTPTDCLEYSCNPANGRCYRTCTTDAHCAPPNTCKNGKCK